MSPLGQMYFETTYCQIVSDENRSSIFFFVTFFFFIVLTVPVFMVIGIRRRYTFLYSVFHFQRLPRSFKSQLENSFLMFSFRAPPKLEPAHALSSSLLVEFVSQKQERRTR